MTPLHLANHDNTHGSFQVQERLNLGHAKLKPHLTSCYDPCTMDKSPHFYFYYLESIQQQQGAVLGLSNESTLLNLPTLDGCIGHLHKQDEPEGSATGC